MFRILSFTIHKHKLLAGKIFELTNPVETNSKNYYSVIIGPNGTGKSYLLNCLIEALNEIATLVVLNNYKIKNKFTLVYSLNDEEYKISTENKNLVVEKNSSRISISEIMLPSKWIANSVTINDKYPIINHIRKKQIPQYAYLGIRSATNNAFISRITINTVLHFVDAIKNNKADKLLTVYESLGLKPKIQIVFCGGPMLKLEKKDNKYSLFKQASRLVEPHSDFIKRNKSTTNYRADNYKRHLEEKDKISKVFDFMSENRSIFEKSTKGRMVFEYSVDLSNTNSSTRLLNDWPILSIMLDLELIKISKFLVNKNVPFKYEEASSGENHLLTSLHGILANLEDNSLVTIDEPEVSLHPNWQVEYFEILKKMIDSYKGVNIIISTHSHFLISSLKNEESLITSVKRDHNTDELIISKYDHETYGMDPESILYNVFGLATLRNKYFELDLRRLISLISIKSQDKNEINRLIEKLSKYILPNDNDPLKLVIEQARKYIGI